LPGSPSNPASQPHDWNRTFVLEHADPVGAALLLHGLSDSPYSLRSIAERLHAEGFFVVGLRMPGHGTLPAELLHARWQDWRAAVRSAAVYAAAQVAEGGRFTLVGYSNGGTLAIDYALEATLSPALRVPDDMILFAPALGVSPVAALASVQRRLAAILGFEKLAWTTIQPEFDPYKYNSFTVAAGEQIYGLTSNLVLRIADLAATDGLADFPPVLVFQSIVDATLPPRLVVDRLLSVLPENGSELVLFDVNRLSETLDFLVNEYDDGWKALAETSNLPFTLSFVTNVNADSTTVVLHTREAGSPPGITSWREEPIDLEWPRGVFSLSHVALPFSAEDPIYGTGGRRDDPRDLRLGAVAARGEKGVLAVPIDQLMRMRYNPFFPFVERRIVRWVQQPVGD
jgi:pimeloyl-ACP methyl ester carboxylesterase